MGTQPQSLLNGFLTKPCDSCNAAPAAVYCRPDSAFLCLNCDAKIHALKIHPRVWICEVCEQAPAAVTCKADAAALCVTCDSDIHSANPLARRHDRVPVQPFFDSADSVLKPSSVFNFLNADDVDVAAPDIKPSIDHMFFTEIDSSIDFHYPIPVDNQNAIHDCIVPVQTMDNCHDVDFCSSKLNSFVSCSSLDVGIVPEENSVSGISYPVGQTVNSGADSGLAMSGSVNQATQLCGLDREARVLRYREKRKNRKFEKTIRYASRKAYAETRPRIKGRFAKRTEMLSEVDGVYGPGATSEFFADFQYGVVPSF